MLMLSLRFRSNDHLWFSFFHEAAHILLHRKRLMFLEFDKNAGQREEVEANRFAADVLIPPQAARELFAMPKSKSEVEVFADRLGIAPGIVVGRIQHEGLLPHTHLNDLKVRYAWT